MIAEKHGGAISPENLALSCTTCNRRKSSDIASFDPHSGALTSLFNPRASVWQDHFEIRGALIHGRTAVGRTTVSFLQLNASERVVERAAFMRAGSYPVYLTARKPR